MVQMPKDSNLSKYSSLGRDVDWLKNDKNYKNWMKHIFIPKVKAIKKSSNSPVDIPYHFVPRWYQMDVIEAMYEKRFVFFCMHRRSGKDFMSISMLLVKAMEKVGSYLYLLPTATQGREIVWKGMDNDGMRFIDHIPTELIKRHKRTGFPMINEQQMRITLINGSTIKVVGSDNYDRSLVGTNVQGIIFSEYSLSDPRAWVYSRPILSANGGWAWFNGTPRAKNHFYKLYAGVATQLGNDLMRDWYAIVRRNSDTGVVPKIELDRIRAEGQMSEQQIQQEFECAWEGCLEGIIYEHQIVDARRYGRFGDYPFDKKCLVYVAFDIGAGDRTALTFFQQRGDRPWVIDFYSANGMGINHFKMVMTDYTAKYGYEYGCIFIPHDARKRSVDNYDEQGFSLTTEDTFRKEFGSIDIRLVPRCNDINEDIEVVRSRFYKWHFNEGTSQDKAQRERLEYFYEAMMGYKYKEVDEQVSISIKPLHNWCSDPMDSFRYAVKAQAFGWSSKDARIWLSALDTEHTVIDVQEVEDCYGSLI